MNNFALAATADKKHLEKLTGVSDPKSALPVLYYSEDQAKKKFVAELSETTLKNLSIVQSRINGI